MYDSSMLGGVMDVAGNSGQGWNELLVDGHHSFHGLLLPAFYFCIARGVVDE